MSLANMLDQLGIAEDLDKEHWIDEPDHYLPTDFEGEEVEVGGKYWDTYDGLVYDDPDIIADFLELQSYEPEQCSWHTLVNDYGASLVTFDAYGNKDGARRNR